MLNENTNLCELRNGFNFSSIFFRFQTSTSLVYFTKTLWPEFTFWHLLAGVFYYQRHYQTMNNIKHEISSFVNEKSLSKDIEQVRQSSKLTETCTGTKLVTLSQRAADFISKFDKRIHNQLVELSTIKV